MSGESAKHVCECGFVGCVGLGVGLWILNAYRHKGQSRRKLRAQLKEHLTSYDSEVMKHVEEEGHDRKSRHMKIHHHMNKGRRRDMLELGEINVDILS